MLFFSGFQSLSVFSSVLRVLVDTFQCKTSFFRHNQESISRNSHKISSCYAAFLFLKCPIADHPMPLLAIQARQTATALQSAKILSPAASAMLFDALLGLGLVLVVYVFAERALFHIDAFNFADS